MTVTTTIKLSEEQKKKLEDAVRVLRDIDWQIEDSGAENVLWDGKYSTVLFSMPLDKFDDMCYTIEELTKTDAVEGAKYETGDGSI